MAENSNVPTEPDTPEPTGSGTGSGKHRGPAAARDNEAATPRGRHRRPADDSESTRAQAA